MTRRSFMRLVAVGLWYALVGMLASTTGSAQTSAGSSPHPPEQRDGQRDFDFEIGNWITHLRRLDRPLTGSSTWIEYTGTSVVRKVWGGQANLVELDVTGPAGRIEGLSLRLYDPEARHWSLNFANRRVGALTSPVIGGFTDGRGTFYGKESLDGRTIDVRFVISPMSRDSIRFEQAFSTDGGRTWEVNWIAVDTRVSGPHDPRPASVRRIGRGAVGRRRSVAAAAPRTATGMR